MKNAIAYCAALLIIIQGAWYSWKICHHTAYPTLATWLLFGVAVALSWWTYWSTKKHSVFGNIANAADLVAVTIILTALIASGNASIRSFNRFDLCCLAACGLILAFWRVSKKHGTANVLLQVVMSVAYFPTLHTLWFATKTTEPISAWVLGCVAAICGIISSALHRDKLGILYPARALAFMSLVIVLILRLRLR